MEELLIKYFRNELNAQEIEHVKSWLNETPQNREIYNDYLKIWTHSSASAIFDKIPVEEDWQRVKSNIRFQRKSNKDRSYFTLLIKIAASVALLITMGIVGYMVFTGEKQHVLVVNDQPDRNNNVVVLADGTKVTLNANSQLIYPDEFKGDERNVELKGEAYFEVAKNPQKPFVIHHGNSYTRVLGTKFNLRAYPREKEVLVAVTEGKVQLSDSKDKKNKLILTHNRVGIYHRDTRKMVRLENMDSNFLSWRTGILSFHNSSLTKVVKDLKRHYRISFVFQDKPKANDTYVSAQFEKQKLKDVLDELSMVTGIPFVVKKNFVLVKNK